MKIAWILALCLLTAPAIGQQAAPREAPPTAEETAVPELVNRAIAAYQEKDYAAMEEQLARAVEQRPYLAQLRYLLAKSYALQDKKREAYDALVRLQQSGLSFELEGDSDFDNIRGYPLYDHLVGEFAKNAEPYGTFSTPLAIARSDLLLESMTHDPKRDQLLVGSVINGTVYHVQDDGSLSAFIEPDEENGLLGITSMAVDAERGVLWVASGASPHVSHARLGDNGKSYLHKFDLDSGKPLGRFSAPASKSYLIDLALAPDGSVFAADTLRPVVWQLPSARAASPDDEALELFFAGGTLTGIRAITVDDAGEHLYFSDYEFGLFGVQIEEKKPFMLHLGQDVNLSGIDAMEWYEDSLVLVQNGVVPRRVMRFQLFPDRRRGRHIQAMVSGQESFSNPVAMTVTDGHLHLIANSHRNAYDPRTGKLAKDAQLKPHPIIRAELDYGWMPPPVEPG